MEVEGSLQESGFVVSKEVNSMYRQLLPRLQEKEIQSWPRTSLTRTQSIAFTNYLIMLESMNTLYLLTIFCVVIFMHRFLTSWHNIIQSFPDLQCFHLWFFDFIMVQKQCTFRRNHISNSKFWSFSELATCCMIFLWWWVVNLSSQSATWFIRQIIDTHATILYTYNHSFSLSVMYSMNSMRYYKIGFVSDTLTQL